MPRPERALGSTDSPVARFAHELRQLRREAGSPSYRDLGQRVNYSPSVLSTAAAGRALPTLAVTRAFALACQADPAPWERRWREAASQLAIVRHFGPSGEQARQPGSSQAAAPGKQHQLPPDVCDFTGRSADLAALLGLLEPAAIGWHPEAVAGRTIAIVGMAGTGKTTLATHVAHLAASNFPDGQLFLDLHGMSASTVSAGDALSRLLVLLGVQPAQIPSHIEDRAAVYRSLLLGRRVLLVLDDVPDDEQYIRLLLPPHGCACLITCRSVLATVAGIRRVAVTELDDETAVRFLGRIVGPERISREPAAARVIVRLCDHLPLAIRVVGARLAVRPTWPLSTLAHDLADERTRLSVLALGDVGMRSGLAQSYARLNGASQRLLRRLALLQRTEFGHRLAAALAGDPDQSAKRELEELIDASLLTSPTPGRYRISKLVQLFAQERIGAEEARTALIRLQAAAELGADAVLPVIRPECDQPPVQCRRLPLRSTPACAAICRSA
jgi:hypothetical protein